MRGEQSILFHGYFQRVFERARGLSVLLVKNVAENSFLGVREKGERFERAKAKPRGEEGVSESQSFLREFLSRRYERKVNVETSFGTKSLVVPQQM